MPASIHAGDVLAERYQMVDLLSETKGGWFWCAHDDVLHRQVAVHLISADDDRADRLMAAARRSAALVDRRNLRVLDADRRDNLCYVVNEWGTGESLDKTLANEGPLGARRAAWLVAEVADTLAVAHDNGRAHGRLVPENVLVDENGQVRIIGFGVDAALHGLEADSPDQDVRDLVGVLYAALTGKWPGEQESVVAAAPVEHGHPLRPRQVRAGIPRVLDQVCDQVLGGGHGRLGVGRGHLSDHDLTTAAGVRDALEEFLGDVATGSIAPTMVPLPLSSTPPSTEPENGSPTGSGEAPARPGAATTGSADVPTEAGMPVFHEDDVEWLRARANRPAPPPDFDEPAERPLFAPEPAEGTPVRRPRAPRPAPTDGSEYWPWDTSTGHGSLGTGSGLMPVVQPEHVPGRRWMTLAWIVGVAALILLAVVAAYQLGGGGLGDGDEDPAAEQSESGGPGEPTPYTDVTVTDFDPQGSPPEENPDLAPLVVDGDATTTWRTQTYEQQFGPGGLKTGVGITLDLGEVGDVSRVEISVVGGATTAEVHLFDEAPTSLAGSEAAGSGADPATIVVELDEARSARFVTVWLTAVPAIESGFRGEVSEVVVSG